MPPLPLLTDPKNYWKKERTRQFSVLIDGADYFGALYESLLEARHSVLVTGWDIGAQVELIKDGDPRKNDEWPTHFGPLLHALASRRPDLHIHVLGWNYPWLFVLDREVSPFFNSGWKSHPRLHLHLDDVHPVGACHHQKIVVIDDSLAYSGGIDICGGRWDTCSHSAHDPRRVDFKRNAYGPFHDVQCLVDGNAARALGDWVRVRWRRSTGDEILPPPARTAPWPAAVNADLREIDAAISLTYPNYGGYPEQREVEHLTLAALRSARRLIYIENQYLVCPQVTQRLAESLAHADGPEIVVVLPRLSSARAEEWTMGVLQNRRVAHLRRADVHGRLGIFYPTVADLGREHVVVHAKLMIIDDDFLKVGSSNLNNRSMGLDTECDVSVEAGSDPERRRGIAGVRERLLVEHTGLPVDELRLATAQGRLRPLLARTGEAARGLRPLRKKTPLLLRWLITQEKFLDPLAPLPREQLISEFLSREKSVLRRRPIWGAVALMAALLALATLWHTAPLAEWRSGLLAHPHIWTIGLAVFWLGGLVLLPTTLLVLTALTLLGARHGLALAWVGVSGAALIQYGWGRLVPRRLANYLVRRRLNGLAQRLARMRLMPAFFLRALPVAPFTVMNLVSGASRTPLPSFLILAIFGPFTFLVVLGGFELSLELIADLWGARGSAIFLVILAFAIGTGLAIHPKGRRAVKRSG